MKSNRNELLTIAGLLLVSAIGAHATPITWTLQDVQFSSGAVTGSFVYDADLNPGYHDEAGVILSGSMTTPDGLSYPDPFGFFTATVPHLIFSTPTDGVNLTGTSWLWVDTNGYLTDAGGSVSIKEAFEQLCMSPGCGDASTIATTFSGELVAQSTAPEPPAALLGALGFLVICGFSLRSTRRGELLSAHLLVKFVQGMSTRPKRSHARFSSRSFSGRRIVSGGTALLLLANWCSGNLVAQTSATITIPATFATGIALAGAANYQATGDIQWKHYEDEIILATLNYACKRAIFTGQPLATSDYNLMANQLRAWLDPKAPHNPNFADEAAYLRYAVDTAVAIVGSGSGSQNLALALGALENAKLVQLESPLNPNRQSPADLALTSVSGQAFQFIGDTEQDASDLAHSNAAYAAAVNQVIFDLLGVDSTASYASVQTLFSTALPALPSANSDGSYTVATQSLWNQYTATITAVEAGIDSALTAIEAAQTSGTTAGAAFRSQSRGGAVAFGLRPMAGGGGGSNSTGGNNADAQGVITALSKAVGLLDSQSSKQIQTVGTAVIQASKAVDQLGILSGADISLPSFLTDLTSSLSFIGPVGSLAGAAVNIFSSLFGGGSSSNSANAAILAGIQKLSQQITRLQADMDNQFIIVDNALTTILTTLNSNFALINYSLGVLNGNVQSIQVGLLDIQTQLNQLSVISVVFAQTQEYSAFSLYMNSCLNYAGIHNGGDIGQSAWNTCESQFYNAAVVQAADQIWVGLQNPSYADSGLYNLFLDNQVTGVCSGCSSPFSTLVNFLSNYPSASLNLPALSTVRLPNPEIWILMARAYTELAREWPQYASAINSSRFNDVIQQALGLQTAIRSTNSANTGATPVGNPAIFNAIVSKYNAAITNVQTALQAEVSNYVQNPANGVSKNGATLNIFAGAANQHAAWPSQDLPSNATGGVGFCIGADPSPNSASLHSQYTMSVISNLTWIPDVYAFAQSYLNYGALNYYCIENVQWVNVRGQVADLRVTLGAQFGSPAVGSVYVAYATVTATGLPMNTDPGSATFINWNSRLLPLFTSPTITQVPLLPDVLTQIDNASRKHEINIYRQIASDLGAVTAIQVAVQQLTGYKLLAQAYCSFGLPNACATNDSLHAALFGNQALPDLPKLEADFASFSASPAADPSDNKISDEIAAMTSASAALSSALSATFSGISQTGTADFYGQLDTTISDLQAIVDLKNARALLQCDYQVSPGVVYTGSGAGAVNVAVQVNPGCAPTAAAGASWLSATSPQSGNITVSISQNSAQTPREAVVVFGNQLLRVVQGPSNLAPQTITFGRISPITLPASPFTLTGSASSGLPITYVSTPNGTCTVSGSTLTPVAAGTCSVIASQPGNSTYAAATPVTQSFAITGASLQSQAITFPAISPATLPASPFTLTGNASSGLPITYVSTPSGVCTVSGSTLTPVAAGTCSVTASQPGNSTYAAATPVTQSFAITGASLQSQTITFPAISPVTLPASPFTLTGSASSGLPITYVSTPSGVCTVSGSTLTPVAAGTCSVTATQTGNSTWAAANPVTKSFAINPAATGGGLAVTTSSLPTGSAGVYYSAALGASGGTSPYSWSISSGGLPQGMSLTSLGGILAGLIEGTTTTGGTYSFTVLVTDSKGNTASKQLVLTINSSILITSVCNSASYVCSGLAPGEIAVIFGTGFTPATSLVGLQLDSTGKVATSLGGVQVLFDGVAAPLIYVSATQLSAVVPYGVAGKSSTQVQVSYQGQTSGAQAVPVLKALPGIFTLNASGTGPGAILNQDGTVNSASNPAAAGSVIVIYATGEGMTGPLAVDGVLDSYPAPIPLQSVTASINGVTGKVLYAGGVSGLVAGVLQVNVQLPPNVAVGNSVPVVLSVGGVNSQLGVTAAIH